MDDQRNVIYFLEYPTGLSLVCFVTGKRDGYGFIIDEAEVDDEVEDEDEWEEGAQEIGIVPNEVDEVGLTAREIEGRRRGTNLWEYVLKCYEIVVNIIVILFAVLKKSMKLKNTSERNIQMILQLYGDSEMAEKKCQMRLHSRLCYQE